MRKLSKTAKRGEGLNLNPAQRSVDRKVPEDLEVTHDMYITERETLGRLEQANYENYRKTILTLSAAFLAFSVSFLGLIKKNENFAATSLTLAWSNLLIATWISFAVSVLLTLLCFPVNAMSFRVEVMKIEDALADVTALHRNNRWARFAIALHFLSGATFVLGLTLLLLFCGRNIKLF